MALPIKSTPENRKLVFNAIKAKILKHLEELEKEKNSEMKKTFSELTGLLIKGGKGLPVGTIREWKGKKFIKVAPGKWRPKYDSETRGARMSIAAIKRKADSCEDAQSLMALIFENKDRFSDENGAPLACVKELSDFIEQTRIEKEKTTKKTSGTSSGGSGDDGEPPNGKKGKLQVLNKKELHDFIEKHKTSKENVRVSLGEISDEARNRIKEKTGLLVNRVILDSDSVRHAYSKPQHNLNPNDLDDMKNIIETTTDIEMGGINPQGNPIIIFKKQEVNGIILCEEYRAKNKELELQTAYRIKKEKRQPHGANERLPANVRNATAPTTSIPQSSEKSSKGLEKIKDNYNRGKHIKGDQDEIYVGDKTLSGTWKLVEAEAPSASHDEKTFRKTEGFPENKDGSTINDRDYENDKAAQLAVLNVAGNYDGRALSFDTPVVVTQDGVVVSGNNRTMSSKLAAEKGTDKAYIEALKKRVKKFGFTQKDLEGFKHPRVVFEIENDGDYSTDQFAQFNVSETKTMNPIEQAVKISKIIKADTVKEAAAIIGDFETMGELYADSKAVSGIFDTFEKSGIINQFTRPQYENEGVITGAGKEFVETVLIGSVVNEKNIRGLTREGCKNIRRKLVRAITPLINNKSMGGYSITDELNEAVDIIMQVNINKDKFKSVEEFAAQGSMFEDKNTVAIELAKKLENKEKEFADFMQSMNAALEPGASGQADIFFGNVETKEDVLKRMLSLKKSLSAIFSQTLTTLKSFYEDNLREYIVKSFNEAEHRRDERGRFTEKGEESKKWYEKPPATKEEILEFTEDCLKNKYSTEKYLYLGKPTNNAVNKIKQIIGIVINKITLSSSAVSHTLKSGQLEKHKLSKKDICRIMDIINDNNTIIKFSEKDHRGKKPLEFIGNINGKIILVEAIREKFNELSFIDMYRPYKENRGEAGMQAVTPPSTHVRNASPPSSNIPHFNENVNGYTVKKSLTYSGYPLEGRAKIHGMDISIENKKGSVRSGVDKDGHEWAIKMAYDYGYIRGTVGKDKDHVDVYIGNNPESEKVFIVHQNDPTTGKYDEDKVMIGFNSAKEAKAAYLRQYDRPGFFGKMIEMTIEEFKEKAFDKKNKGKMIA